MTEEKKREENCWILSDILVSQISLIFFPFVRQNDDAIHAPTLRLPSVSNKLSEALMAWPSEPGLGLLVGRLGRLARRPAGFISVSAKGPWLTPRPSVPETRCLEEFHTNSFWPIDNHRCRAKEGGVYDRVDRRTYDVNHGLDLGGNCLVVLYHFTRDHRRLLHSQYPKSWWREWFGGLYSPHLIASCNLQLPGDPHWFAALWEEFEDL